MAYVRLGATLKDCEELAPRLREIDVKEIRAIAGAEGSPYGGLRSSVEHSEKTFAVIGDREQCIAIFGVGRVNDEGGVPWMLCSEELFEQHSRQFRKQCAVYSYELTKGYKWLCNYVAKENTKAIRWLTWLGFTVDHHKEHTFGDLIFLPFWYRT